MDVDDTMESSTGVVSDIVPIINHFLRMRAVEHPPIYRHVYYTTNDFGDDCAEFVCYNGNRMKVKSSADVRDLWLNMCNYDFKCIKEVYFFSKQ